MEGENKGCDNCSDVSNQASYSFQEEETVAGIQFSPPLYIQRYMLAVEYLTKHSIHTVVDFGCSECGFFQLLSTVTSLQEISLVDIDHDLLISKTKVISPQLKDYVHRRPNPLSVFMYAGSAADFDRRMKNYQAVTLIEVIEHLHPDVLDSVTCNVFGAYRPLHVIVTTPNAEFNVLFGNENPTAFRHWDHKFEWTREQFRSWCQSVCENYGYEVEYTGVGFQSPKQNSSDLGPCSQAAFFRRGKEKVKVNDPSCCVQELDSKEVYELIANSEFPYNDIKITMEEKLDMEISYTLRQIIHLKVEDSCRSLDGNDNESFCIDIRQLAKRNTIKSLASLQEVRNYLKQKSYEISEDGETFTINVSQFLDPSSDDDDEEDDNSKLDDYSNDESKNQNICCCGHNIVTGGGDRDNAFCDGIHVDVGDCTCRCPVVHGGDLEECWDTPD